MRFGVGIPTCREGIFYPMPFAGPQEIVQATQLAEKLGYDSVWGTEFINPSPMMKLEEGKKPNFYDLMISLSYLAAVTKKIKLAAGVLLLPYHDPVLLAKEAATLDQFSGGRFLFGWGLGGFKDEFHTVKGKLAKAHRGNMLDECMEALHRLLNSDSKVSFEGEYYAFHDVELDPKPIQKPLPVYIAGHTGDTPNRIAKYAQGISVSVSAVSGAGQTFKQAMDILRHDLEKEGADPYKFDVEISTQQLIAKTHEEAVRRFKESYLGKRLSKRDPDAIIKNSVVGTPAEVVEHVKELEKAGITLCMTTNMAVDTFSEFQEQMHWMAEEVMPHFKQGVKK